MYTVAKFQILQCYLSSELFSSLNYRLELLSSDVWSSPDKQKAMHMSTPCELHRWAKMSISWLFWSIGWVQMGRRVGSGYFRQLANFCEVKKIPNVLKEMFYLSFFFLLFLPLNTSSFSFKVCRQFGFFVFFHYFLVVQFSSFILQRQLNMCFLQSRRLPGAPSYVSHVMSHVMSHIMSHMSQTSHL